MSRTVHKLGGGCIETLRISPESSPDNRKVTCHVCRRKLGLKMLKRDREFARRAEE